ncbi:unnamed protein product [Bathycoccus prasinos]
MVTATATNPTTTTTTSAVISTPPRPIPGSNRFEDNDDDNNNSFLQIRRTLPGACILACPTPEERPQVVRSPIPARGAQRSQVVRLSVASTPPNATRLSVASTPPNATLMTPVVTAVETHPVAVAIVPETTPGPVTVVAEEGDDDLGVQFEPETDEGTAADDAAVPAMPAAPPALEEAGDPGARLVSNAGGEVRAEPGVRMEADAGGEGAGEGAVAANVEAVVGVPSGNDAFALLEERGIRLENVELEGGVGLGDQLTPEEIFEKHVADERSATTEKGKFENPKTEPTLNHYFREIFHALVCGKIALDVAYSLMENCL